MTRPQDFYDYFEAKDAPVKQAADGSYRLGEFDDVQDGRKGEWQQTSLGGRFYPSDPRPEEVFISDIANGLALDCRYAGQGMVTRFYSVAEHSVHMARYARRAGWRSCDILATLLHDAPEAFLNDLPRAVKHAVGGSYEHLEEIVQAAIDVKYGLTIWRRRCATAIKTLDRRMVPLEKEAIMRRPQHWAYDQFPPLEGVQIMCWSPAEAKRQFLYEFVVLAQELGLFQEEIEYD